MVETANPRMDETTKMMFSEAQVLTLFPDPKALASVPQALVLSQWSAVAVVARCQIHSSCHVVLFVVVVVWHVSWE